ncbi:hypothetical protein KZZ52_41340 [Dactylosporangium sp. AC04546]|uniref:YncE family protein n=1 Tax=Dactylosporangium sp. AC04546 TaxID=2862460 RepID=UPI001EE0E967|nr:hypothetical protein [Dactylosporangium sp. AC04546]WVK80374.1 hypothetical protein KZZ52_41340 [Dactylosporangium sp. AC04546]
MTVPTPTWAPAPSVSPAGTTASAGAAPAAVAVEAGGARTAVASPSTVTVLSASGNLVEKVPVDEPATAVVALPRGGFRALAGRTVLQLTESGVQRWSLPGTGSAIAVPPTGDWTAVALPATGEVIILSPTGTVSRTIATGVRPTALAADDSRIAVVDASESSLTVFDAATGARQEGLRAGDGAVTVTSGGGGRFVVVDARDGELLVFDSGPLILRQRHPVAGTPYGVSYDAQRRTLWVTVTQRNEVAGFDISGGTPREVARHPAVQLPVAVSVDPSSGALAVAGFAEGLVQRIVP